MVKKKWVYLTHSGLVLQFLQLVQESAYITLSDYWRKYFKKYALLKLISERKKIIRSKQLLSIHGPWTSGYHHWFTESLIKLVQVKDVSQYSLIIPKKYPSFAIDSLQAFPFKEIIFIPKNTGVLAQNLTIVGNPTPSNFLPKHVTQLRNQLVSHLQSKVTIQKETHRIYISRKTGSSRYVENDDALIVLLSKFGFKTIYSEELSFWEQIELFYSCELLIGIHGAGLTNMILMKEKSKVIELKDNLKLTDRCFQNLAIATGLTYISFEAKTYLYEGRKKDQDYHLTVDCKEIEQILNAAI